MSKQHKFDLFGAMAQIDRRNFQWYQTLTPEEAAEFVPLVVTRWMSSTPNVGQLIALNEYVNKYIFSLQSHKELLYKLLCCAASGKVYRYNWVKTQNKKEYSKPLSTKLVQQYANISMKEANESLEFLTKDDIINIAINMGLENAERTKIEKEHA